MKIGKKMMTGSSLMMMIGVIFAATILVSAAVVVLSATKTNGVQPVRDYPVSLTLTSGPNYQSVYSTSTDLHAWTASSASAGNSYGERFSIHYNGQDTPSYAIMVTVKEYDIGNHEIQDNDISIGYYDVIENQEEFIPTMNTTYRPIQFHTTGPNTMFGIFSVYTAENVDSIVWMEIIPQVGGDNLLFVVDYQAVPMNR